VEVVLLEAVPQPVVKAMVLALPMAAAN